MPVVKFSHALISTKLAISGWARVNSLAVLSCFGRRLLRCVVRMTILSKNARRPVGATLTGHGLHVFDLGVLGNFGIGGAQVVHR